MENKNENPKSEQPDFDGSNINKVEERPEAGALIASEVNEADLTNLKHYKPSDTQGSMIKSKHSKKFYMARPRKQVYTSAKKLQKRVGWKRRLFNFAVVLVLGVATGSVLGGWYYNKVISSQIDYSKYKVEDYIDDQMAIVRLATGKDSPTEADIENFAELAKAQGKTPLDFTPSQNMALAEYKSTLADTFRIIGNGKVATIATQSVYSRRLFNGSRYTFESISKGLMSIARCSVMDKGANKIKYLDSGTNITATSAQYNLSKAKDYTLADYNDFAGGTPDKFNSYIISSKTIIEEENVEVTYNEENKTYEFTVNLDPIGSVLNYAKQVRQTSGLDGTPDFTSVKIKVVMNEDWDMVQMQIEEKYSVVYGVRAKCTGTLTLDFEFNVDDIELPV